MDLHRFWTVEALSAPIRLDRFIALQNREEAGWSRSVAARLIRQGMILVQGKKVTEPDFLLRGGEYVELNTAETGPQKPVKPPALRILYEDRYLMAVAKPCGVLTHPTSSLAFRLDLKLSEKLGVHQTPSVEHWVVTNYPACRKISRHGIVHRLDREASGVLLIAKTQAAWTKMTAMFRDKQIEKTYWALSWGKINPPSGVLDFSIGKKYSKKGVRLFSVAAGKSKTAKTAWTSYRLIRSYPYPGAAGAISLLELKPATGRTHQLRLHLAACGHPICGDRWHQSKMVQDPFNRLMLHARRLRFKHSAGKKILDIAAPVPEDFSSEMLRILNARI